VKLIIQRVKSASITIDSHYSGKISDGLVILVGITHTDDKSQIDYCAEKAVNLRIFNDEAGQMNKSAIDINAHLLVVSQFTLYGNTSKGRRPSYIDAAKPEIAMDLYTKFVERIKQFGLYTITGKFAADMQVELVNDGPVTLIVEKQ